MSRKNRQSIYEPPKPEEPQVQSTAPVEPDPMEGATVIAKGVTVTGDLFGTGDVLIEGTVIGRIKLDGTVTVAKTSVVKGPIQAESVYVSGAVKGNIAAKKCLRLEITGSIIGDVTVSSFIIEDGAYFNGRSHMTKTGEEPVIEY